MNKLRAILVSLALAAAPASAASVAGDQNDWWFTPGEGGWAINVAHQADTVFIAWYLYNQAGNPVWYSGSGVLTGSTTNPVFAGDLFTTTGPWFGGPYNQSAVARRVGTFTFNPSAQNQAQLAYSIDGVPVTKPLQRFLFKHNNLSGSYAASVSQWGTGCGPADDGAHQDDVNVQITHNANNWMVIVSGSAPDICTITGTYAQTGRLGTFTGTMVCPDTPPGGVSYTLSEIDVTTADITARILGQFGTCRVTGNLAAARRVIGP